MEKTFDTLGKAMAESVTPVLEWQGRWYIAMGQPGYNSLANNRNGYSTYGRAMAAIDFWRRDRHIVSKVG